MELPLVCSQKVNRSWSVTSYRSEAEKIVSDSKGQATFLELKGGRAREKEIKSVFEVEE